MFFEDRKYICYVNQKKIKRHK